MNRINTIKRSNSAHLLVMCLIFIINPFLSFLLTAILLLNKNVKESDYYKLIIPVVLFLALLAFSQYTETGDVIRTYNSVKFNMDLGVKGVFLNKYPLFDLINIGLYSITGRVETISIFWIFIVYYSIFCATFNMFKFRQIPVTKNNLVVVYFVSIICVVIFTQVTEIMKQAVVVSVFYYLFSLLLLGKSRISYVIFFMLIGIHYSILFFLPLLFIKKYSFPIVAILTIVSFAFRSINLMQFVSGFSDLGSIAALAHDYSAEIQGFFKSTSFFFTICFLIYCSTVIIYITSVPLKDNIIVTAAMVMIIILNLNFSSSHNFTRLLTSIYPFYIMLLVELYNRKVKLDLRKIILLYVITGTLSVNIVLSLGRLSVQSSYGTSYMNNDVVSILTSNCFDYIDCTKNKY